MPIVHTNMVDIKLSSVMLVRVGVEHTTGRHFFGSLFGKIVADNPSA